MTDTQEFDRQRRDIHEKIDFMVREMIDCGTDRLATAVALAQVSGGLLKQDEQQEFNRMVRDAATRDAGMDPSVWDEDPSGA